MVNRMVKRMTFFSTFRPLCLILLSSPFLVGWNNNFAGQLWQNQVVVAPYVGDPCFNPSAPPVGTMCDSGTLYAGEFNGSRYMVTPGNCTYQHATVCDGDTDGSEDPNQEQPWGLSTTLTSATSLVDGASNQAQFMAYNPSSGAAYRCYWRTQGGYGDWFLPAKDEFLGLFNGLGTTMGFASGYYWTSTETSNTTAWRAKTDGSTSSSSKGFPDLFRCVRKFSL
jgi:hypothetical protein